MPHSVSSRGSTISSLIASSPQTPSALSPSAQSVGIMPATPLSAAAIKISRDSRLLEHLMPKVGQGERMLLLNWFLEEEKLKQYEVFKSEFLEDPDEYNYALSSLLGTLVWDVTPVSPNSGTIGTFVAPNLTRRNNLYPFQAALTEKWKVIGAVFSHSWNNALDKPQREALIMRSFIDTANINEDMTNARRQSFDLRTSELSGRGFISFIQEHCLQSTNSQTGGTPVSLPHTENMVRVFKDWVDKSGSPPEDENNDTLFRRSCALSLRDKCIYARALFATRLCITVLEMWEQIIRQVESKRRHTSKSDGVTIECPPVTAVTEVEAPAKPTKPKKKKKAKSGKRARRMLADPEEKVDDKPTAKNLETELRTTSEALDFGGFEDEFAVASGTDDSKSSGHSSPTGTGGEGSKFSSSTKVELKNDQRDVQGHVGHDIGNRTLADGNGDISEFTVKSAENLHGKHENNEQAKISIASHEFKSQEVDSTTNSFALETPHVSIPDSTDFGSSFPIWEDYPDKLEAEWLPVTGKKRKGQAAEKHRPGSNNHSGGRKTIAEVQQSIAALRAQKAQGNDKNVNKPTQVQPAAPAMARPQPQPIHRLPLSQPLKTTITHQTTAHPIGNTEETSRGIDSVTCELLEESIVKLLDVKTAPPMKEVASIAGINSPDVSIKNVRMSSVLPATTNADEVNTTVAYPAESEPTNVSTTSATSSKGKKQKSQRKRVKSISKEDATELVLSHASRSTPFPSEPLNLESVTFFCAVCHRPRSYHHSVQCSMCGPESTIRYCSAPCQRQDTEHWRLCGLTPFSMPVLVPGKTMSCRPSMRNTFWMTPALARQRMLLVDQPNIDYILFNPSSNAPKHKIVFQNEKLKSQFTKLRQNLFQQQDVKGVALMYRVIRSRCDDMGIIFTPRDLACQLFSEFGVDPLLSSTSGELRISPQDWIEVGVSA